MGKCVDENTSVFTPKGNVKIKDINVGDYVYSMKDNEIVKRKVLNKWNTTKKQVKIITRNGKEIITSKEHRMFTQRGYVASENLTTNDYLYSLLTKMDGKYEINDDELTFIAGMIFEGSCTENIFSFTQEDNEFKDYFLKSCDNLGITHRETEKNNCKAKSYWFHKRDGIVRNLLKKYEIYECNSHTKRLPKCFFEMPLKQKYKFISIMLATDGYVPNYNELRELVGITLANEKLIDDIQALLSTCGIYSKKSYKKAIFKDNKYLKSEINYSIEEYNESIFDEYFK